MDKYQVKKPEIQEIKRESSQERYRKLSNEKRVLSRDKSGSYLPSMEIKRDDSKKMLHAGNILPNPNRNYMFRAPPKYK